MSEEFCIICSRVVELGEHDVVFKGKQRTIVIEGSGENGRGGRAHILLTGRAKEEALAAIEKQPAVVLVVPITPLPWIEASVEQQDTDAPISEEDAA